MSKKARDRLLEHFVARTTARAAAELVGVHRNTAAGFYTRLRHVIAEELATASPVAGEVEVDESYFGGVRKGKRGRGAAGKVPVFGLLKRGGKVYTVVIPNVRTATLLPIIERMIRPDSIVYTDGFRSYDALGCLGLPPCADQPCGAVWARADSHQWDREFLEPGEAAFAPLQRRPHDSWCRAS